MPGRIVLYGATGYIGGLTAEAMVVSGARPVLAGRDQDRLSAVAARLPRAGGGIELETAAADIERPEPLRQLLEAGDVLVSTAGPFMKSAGPPWQRPWTRARYTWTPAASHRSSARCSRYSGHAQNAPERCC